MPGFTPNLSIPYPIPADNISAYPALAKQNAEALEALLYDSGWIDLTVNAPYAHQGSLKMQIRRIGNVVYPRWGISNAGLAANGNYAVSTIPVGFRPARDIYIPAISSTPATDGLATIKSSTGQLDIRTAATLGSYYILQTPWLIN